MCGLFFNFPDDDDLDDDDIVDDDDEDRALRKKKEKKRLRLQENKRRQMEKTIMEQEAKEMQGRLQLPAEFDVTITHPSHFGYRSAPAG